MNQVVVDPIRVVVVERRAIGIIASVHHIVYTVFLILEQEGGDRTERNGRKGSEFKSLRLSWRILIGIVSRFGLSLQSCVGEALFLALLRRLDCERWQILFREPATATVASASEINDGGF